MKIYVVPVENSCNARCLFCTTKFKSDKEFGNLLAISDLSQIDYMDVDKIEITGGGDPFLHPEIWHIISYCVGKAPTQIYTNASLLNVSRDAKTLKKLAYLCISRSHYDESENERIMGVRQSVNIDGLVKDGVSIKLSVVMCRSGIANVDDLRKFLDWSNKLGVKKVVARRLFDFENGAISDAYKEIIAQEFVSVDKLHEHLKIESCDFHEGNAIFDWHGMEVEIENRSCACEIRHPVLRGNGRMYLGWGRIPWIK